MVTLEAILDRNNLNRAWKQVVKNKGSAGVDGMKVTDLLSHLREHGPEHKGRELQTPTRFTRLNPKRGERQIQTVGDPYGNGSSGTASCATKAERRIRTSIQRQQSRFPTEQKLPHGTETESKTRQ